MTSTIFISLSLPSFKLTAHQFSLPSCTALASCMWFYTLATVARTSRCQRKIHFRDSRFFAQIRRFPTLFNICDVTKNLGPNPLSHLDPWFDIFWNSETLKFTASLLVATLFRGRILLVRWFLANIPPLEFSCFTSRRKTFLILVFLSMFEHTSDKSQLGCIPYIVIYHNIKKLWKREIRFFRYSKLKNRSIWLV